MTEAFFSFFANTLNWWQWLIVALVPPAIIALYFLKLKRMPLEVPSTYLWHRTIEDLHVNSIWQRLRQSLLLLLQLLLILLLIFALLRPGWQGATLVGNRFIFVIDTSASMAAKDVEPTRLDDAKRRIGEMIDQMEAGDVAMLISFSDVARVEQPFTDSRGLLRRKLAQIRQTNHATSIQEALRAAAGLANPGSTSYKANDVQVADAKPATLFIFSDGGFGTVSNFEWGNLAPRYVKLGKQEAANVGILTFSSERNPEKPGQTQAFARLGNFGPEDVTVEATLYQNDELRDVKRVTVPKQSEVGLEYELTDINDEERADEGVLKLVLEHDDPLEVDNVAYTAMNPPRQARVLLITPGNKALKLALGTDEAIKLAKVQISDPKLLEAKAYDEQAASGAYDFIIYDRCRPKRMPQANTLMIGTVPPGDAWKAGKMQSGPLIIDTDRVHPLMQFVEVGNLKIAEGFALTPPAGSTVLIDSDVGTLTAIGPREGFEDVVLGFDIYDEKGLPNTDWEVQRSFPIFVMNALKYLGGVRTSLSTENIRPGQPLIVRSATPVSSISVTSPSGRKSLVRREAENAFVYPDVEETGIYTVQEGQQAKAVRQFAANLFDARESDIHPKAIEVGDVKIEGESAWEPARVELWKWVLIGGLGLLIFEWWVFNRRVYL